MKLVIGIVALAISAAVLSSCTASEKSSATTPTVQDAKSDAPIAYSAVKSDPSEYVGKQVTWVGQHVSSTITATAITNFWKVDGEEDGSVFATTQDDEQMTDAAKARGKIRFDFTRKVVGTISKDQVEYRLGTEMVRVPLLTKVVVDAPDTPSK